MSNSSVANAAPTVIVVGSINMDLVFTGARRLPAPGETTTGSSFAIHAGGKGANQAAAAARLGARVLLVGAVGDDDFGRTALADLARNRVDTSLVRTVAAPTGVAAVLIDADGENAIVVSQGANLLLDPGRAHGDAATIEARDVTVLLSLEVAIDVATGWATVARERGWRVVLNPAPYPADGLPADLLAYCDILTPNQAEFASMEVDASARGLLSEVPAIIITRGSEGAELRRAGHPAELVPALAVQSVDTTGAGDAFSGALAVALGNGASLIAATHFACAVGALATRAVGARGSLPTFAEADALLAHSARRS